MAKLKNYTFRWYLKLFLIIKKNYWIILMEWYKRNNNNKKDKLQWEVMEDEKENEKEIVQRDWNYIKKQFTMHEIEHNRLM
jgi:hypothetical protein